MAPAYVQSNKNALHSVSSVAVAFSSGNSAGNLIVVAAGCWSNTGATPTCTDSAGNTYTLAQTIVALQSRSWWWYAKNCAAGANTVTVNLGGSGPDLDVIIAEYSGCSTSAPLDQSNGDHNSSGTAVSTGSITTTLASAVLIASVYNQSQSGTVWTLTGSPSSGWTQRQQTANPDGTCMAFYDQVVSATGTYNVTFTNNAFSNGQEAFIGAFGDSGTQNQPEFFLLM